MFENFLGTDLGYLPGLRLAGRVPGDWTDEPYSRFSVTPVAPTIGAVVEGVDLSQAIDDELYQQLNRALLEWKVLFFRDQDLDADQQMAAAAHWGQIEAHPFYGAASNFGGPRAEIQTLEKGHATTGNENMWHTDVTWRETPSLGAILRAIEVPPVGGDTLWADTGAAYECMAPELKERIEGRTAIHDWINSFGLAMTEEDRNRLRPDFPPVEHPIVRTHPETGRKTLFVNRFFTQHIVGLDQDESDHLLDLLYYQATFPEYQCRWKWRSGDVAFWDNRATQHYASSDYYPQRRIMERVTICGDRPY